MNGLRLAAVALSLLGSALAADTYPPAPESLPDKSIPSGEILKRTFAASRIYPGTERLYWIYIPAEYRADQLACLYVGQDGIAPAGAANVFDHLIAAHQIPITIAVFVAPGVVPPRDPAHALKRYNRSYEYDSLGDEYVRFLLEELLPDAARQQAADGRAIRFSERAADRAIGGSSSGAIAAFTAAWERPESFSRVYSSVGTYVHLRGGDQYYGLIRRTEPKAIRVFLQDGANDQNIYAGDWWMANQTMERALVFAGYDVNHVWGEGGHNGKQSAAVFPEAMRWLWRGWPDPVAKPVSQNAALQEILVSGADWELVGSGYRTTDGLAVDPAGRIFFDDGPGGAIYSIERGGAALWSGGAERHSGLAFGPDGQLYGFVGTDSLAVLSPGGARIIATGLDRANDLVIARNGNRYITSDPPAGSPSTVTSQVWLVRPDGSKQIVDSGLKFANGLALSPDQSLLYVDDSRSHWVYSYVLAPDGTLQDKQRFCMLVQGSTDDDTSADGMKVDREGRLYVSTRLGVQVCDEVGRNNAILPTPNRKVSSVVLGGPQFDTLYAACGPQVYRRRLKVHGANAWADPVLPPQPHL